MSAANTESRPRWWVCYSPGQQAVHVRTETALLVNSLAVFALNRPVDFVPLAVFDSEGAAREYFREIQLLCDQRRQKGGPDGAE